MRKPIWLAAVPVLFFAAAIASAAGKSSVEMGKELFNDPGFGNSANESSCNSCHAGGKGLESAGDNKKFTKLVNSCIVGRMEGEKMDGRKVSMRSLKMYIRSLNN